MHTNCKRLQRNKQDTNVNKWVYIFTISCPCIYPSWLCYWPWKWLSLHMCSRDLPVHYCYTSQVFQVSQLIQLHFSCSRSGKSVLAPWSAANYSRIGLKYRGNNIMFCILSAWLVAGPQKHRERIFVWEEKKTHLTLVSLAGESYRLWGHYSGLSEGNMKEMGGWWENIILSLMRRSIP